MEDPSLRVEPRYGCVIGDVDLYTDIVQTIERRSLC